MSVQACCMLAVKLQTQKIQMNAKYEKRDCAFQTFELKI